jgi:hypothetical protein
MRGDFRQTRTHLRHEDGIAALAASLCSVAVNMCAG